MKKILFVRHGRAKKDTKLNDKDRPLTGEGIDSVKNMLKNLSADGITFGMVATSPALRAVETAQLFAKTIGSENNTLVIIPEWYEAMTPRSFCQWIKDLPAYIDAVVVVGHNPDLPLLIQYFDSSFNDHIPPAGTVILKFATDTWDMVSRVKAEMMAFKIPSDAADFSGRIKVKEGEIAECIAQSTMQTLKTISGIKSRACEKHVYAYSRKCAKQVIKEMDIVTIAGRENK